MSLRLFVVISLLFISITGAHAEKMHPVLEKFVQDGMKVDYLGKMHGMDGWVILKGDKVQYAYSTKEGGFVLGMLFGPDGNLVTGEQLKSYKARMGGEINGAAKNNDGTEKAEQFFKETEDANWVRIGSKTAPYIYAFVNAKCGNCHNFWSDIEPYVSQGMVQLRLIPFGNAKGNRSGGVALLGSRDPEAVWKKLASGDDSVFNQSVISKMGHLYKKIDANNNLLSKWGLSGVPFIVYKTPKGKEIKVISGQPKNIMLLMADFN